LSEGRLFAADKKLQSIPEKYFDVLKIVREEARNGKLTYDLLENPGQILIFDQNSKQIAILERSYISSKLQKIFEKIKNSTSSTFSIPLAEEVMKYLFCKNIKAGSSKKSDIFLMIYDRISPTTPDLGFSIKSMMGSPSTLLNASKATNFIFKIVGKKIQSNELEKIEGRSKLRECLKFIESTGARIEYVKMENSNFEKNLRMIDTIFPQMIAEAIRTFYEGKGNSLFEIINSLENEKILESKFNFSKDDYLYKIKHFLASIALGMTPVKKWDGFNKAHGGYIIVKEDGELVCYHLYNSDEFQEYLFENTKLETPSTKRHGFGYLYEDNEEQFIKLNLQIRFIR